MPATEVIINSTVPEGNFPDLSPGLIGGGVGGLYGSGAPSNNVGVNGQTYVRSDNDTLYFKSNGTWHLQS